MTSTPAPAPNVASPSAPTFASLSRWTGRPSRSCISAAVSIPSSDGMIAFECTSPGLRGACVGGRGAGGGVEGAGRAHAGGQHAAAVAARLVEQLIGQAGAEVERVVAGGV